MEILASAQNFELKPLGVANKHFELLNLNTFSTTFGRLT